MSVQQNSNLLAVSVAPDNKVYLLDKRSGTTLAAISVPDPTGLSFSPDGSLWVISSNQVVQYQNVNVSPAVATTLASLTLPLAVAVCPTNANLILIADGGLGGGGSQQVKAFDSSGTSLWTYGLPGGYVTNGVAVQTNKFMFGNIYEGNVTFLCFAPDGSFWVGDSGNNRSLHFSAWTGTTLNCMEQIMFQSHSYSSDLDQNNPSRVFNQFLEFKVDYAQPLAQSWTLVNNWGASVPFTNISFNSGLFGVTTLTNGRTYGFFPLSGGNQLVELVTTNGSGGLTNKLRLTGIFPSMNINGFSSSTNFFISLSSSGNLDGTGQNVAYWAEEALTGFDAANNPVWSTSLTTLAAAPNGTNDPVPRCCGGGNPRLNISSNNILISFDNTLNPGMHLGGILVGTTNWLWEASPSGNFNQDGHYDLRST
jgi:hypothetical protein